MNNFEHLNNIGKAIKEIYIEKDEVDLKNTREGKIETLSKGLGEKSKDKYDTAIVVLTAGLSRNYERRNG